MAKYEHLPIYRKALQLIIVVEKAVRGFARFHKYSIGGRLRETCWEAIALIVKVNNTPVAQRGELLVSLRDKIAEVNIALSVARELDAFPNHNSWQQAARMAVDLGTQSDLNQGCRFACQHGFCDIQYLSKGGDLMKLRVLLEPSEDGGFTVIVPALPGCISEGDTREEAIRNIREAIELYLEPVDDDCVASANCEQVELAL